MAFKPTMHQKRNPIAQITPIVLFLCALSISTSFTYVPSHIQSAKTSSRSRLVRRSFLLPKPKDETILSLTATTLRSSPSPEESSLTGIKSLGIDLGEKRTGIAVTIGYSPLPLTILSDYESNFTTLSHQIVRICQSETVSQIILGLPLHKNGTVSEQANYTMEFADVLSCDVHSHFGEGVAIYLWDERYSSKEAISRITASSSSSEDIHPGDLAGTLDSLSACIILEHYYAESGKGAQRVRVPDGMIESCESRWEINRMETRRSWDELMQNRNEALNAREAMMERSKLMEIEMEKEGGLGVSRKQKKKNKKRKKRTTYVEITKSKLE